ncbi:MAG TPA: HEAT repeat domain-containing protein, partial [Planctomycetaceae bacterium]
SNPASRERKLPAHVAMSLPDAIAQLDSPSYYRRFDAQEVILSKGPLGVEAVTRAVEMGQMGLRGRMHALWIVARTQGAAAREKLFEWAADDSQQRVQVQAIRAIADLEDPVLIGHRIDGTPGNAKTAVRLAKLAAGKDARVLFETIVAVGRLRWSMSADWLAQQFSTLAAEPRVNAAAELADPFLAHAAMQVLRKSGNWPAVMRLFDLPDSDPLRSVALRAIADQAVPEVANQLIERLSGTDIDAAHRSQFADLLSRIYKKPGPWTYWGYRPAPRPANAVAWERTDAIEETLNKLLLDADPTLRLFVLRRMQREKIPNRLTILEQWLASERDVAAVAAILESVREHPADKLRELYSRLVADRLQASSNRLTALAQLTAGLDAAATARLLDLAVAVEDGPVATQLIREISRHPQLAAGPFLLGKLKSPEAEVRTAAVDALAELRVTDACDSLRKLLDDAEPAVRRAAAAAAGRFGDRAAIERLLHLGKDVDPAVRSASLDSLRLLGEPRCVALAVAALADRQTQTAALVYLRDLGGPPQAQAVIDLAKGDPTSDVVQLSAGLLTKWGDAGDLPADRRSELDHAVSELQGRSGLTVRWHIIGPVAEAAAAPLLKQATAPGHRADANDQVAVWRTVFASGLESRIGLNDNNQPTGETAGNSSPANSPPGDRVWLATSEVIVSESTPVQFLASASGKLQIWLNGRSLFERDQVRPFQADADRFDGTLETGLNRLVIKVAAPRDSAEFHLRFRRKSSTAEHEALVQAALSRTGDPERGRKLFFDVAKSQCSKCHRIGDLGERIGPELTGIGDRFSRIHIVESILEPSRTVTPGYQTIAVALRSGRVLAGVKIAETDRSLTIGDNQGQKHELAKTEIEEQTAQSQSTMPDGLMKQITPGEFVDLIAFLTSRKEKK